MVREEPIYSDMVKLFSEGTSFKTDGKFVKIEASISIDKVESNIEKLQHS